MGLIRRFFGRIWSTLLEMLGVACLAAFLYEVWRPAAALLPIGIYLLLSAFAMYRSDDG